MKTLILILATMISLQAFSGNLTITEEREVTYQVEMKQIAKLEQNESEKKYAMYEGKSLDNVVTELNKKQSKSNLTMMIKNGLIVTFNESINKVSHLLAK